MFDPWSIVVAGVVIIGVIVIAEAIVSYFQDRREDHRSVQMHFTYDDTLLQSRNHRRLTGSDGQQLAAPGGQPPRTDGGPRRRVDRQCTEDDANVDDCDDAIDGVRQIAAAVASIISASVADESRPSSAVGKMAIEREEDGSQSTRVRQQTLAAALPSVPTTPLAVKPAQTAAAEPGSRRAGGATPASRSSSTFLPSTSPRLRSRAAFLYGGVVSGENVAGNDETSGGGGAGLELAVLGATSPADTERSLPPRATGLPPGASTTPTRPMSARQPASHL